MISFDIDGTMEFGEPPGPVTASVARHARELGFLVGSCSDRPLATQVLLWQSVSLEVDFTVLKQNLPHVRDRYSLSSYLHVGDTELDRRMAKLAGFDFLDSTLLSTEVRWLLDHAERVLTARGSGR